MSVIKELQKKIRQFVDERDWMQFHGPKNMASSIAIEAAELLEHFQWHTPEEAEKYLETHKEEVGEEMADVAIYLLEMAENAEIDLKKAIERKIEKNAKKYPIEKAKGNAKKYTEL